MAGLRGTGREGARFRPAPSLPPLHTCRDGYLMVVLGCVNANSGSLPPVGLISPDSPPPFTFTPAFPNAYLGTPSSVGAELCPVPGGAPLCCEVPGGSLEAVGMGSVAAAPAENGNPVADPLPPVVVRGSGAPARLVADAGLLLGGDREALSLGDDVGDVGGADVKPGPDTPFPSVSTSSCTSSTGSAHERSRGVYRYCAPSAALYTLTSLYCFCILCVWLEVY